MVYHHDISMTIPNIQQQNSHPLEMRDMVHGRGGAEPSSRHWCVPRDGGKPYCCYFVVAYWGFFSFLS